MKTLKQFFSVVALCVAGMFAFASCTVGPEVTESAPVVPFSITYSTGQAVWDEANPGGSEFVLNKLGVGTTGTQAFLEVTSSIYWTVSVEYPEAAEGETPNWMSVTPKGGPSPAQTKTNVYLELSHNSGYDRLAYVVFKTMDKTYKVAVRQRGPLTDATQGKLRFLEDNFGKTVADEVVVKFYPFSDVEGNKTYSGVAAAGGTYAFGYAGSETAFASKEDPSYGYEDVLYGGTASGGVNIMIDGKGYFDVKNFNNQGKTDFYLTFGAKNCDGKFRTEDLKLMISCDQKRWESMEYVHSSHPTNDWSINTLDFSIAPNVSDILYFRFENTSEDLYRIDDLFFIEHEPSDNLYSLIEYGSDLLGMPVNFKFNDLTEGNVKGENWHAFAMVLSEESGAYEEADEADENAVVIDFATASHTSAHMQFVCGSDASQVKRRSDGNGVVVTSGSPKIQGIYEGDYWIWTFPVYNTTAMTNIQCDLTHMATDAGSKYYTFEYAQCTKDEYKLAGMFLGSVTDEDKRNFYDSLDWTIYDPVTIEVPNDEDFGSGGNGIPIGSAAEPSGYWSGEITYSRDFAGGRSSFQRNNTPIVTFVEAMDEGYYFMRLRCASNLTAGACNSTNYQRMNKVDHNGTNYLRQVAKFSFHSCGTVVDSSDGGYKFLSIINGLDVSTKYTGEAPVFASGADMGAFAGAAANISSETFGNNTFAGVCDTANEQTGKAFYVYHPYDATNETPENVKVSVPAKQYFDDGYLVCNAAPFVQTNTQTFRTTRTIRCDVETPASLLNLRIFANESLNNKLWRIDLEANTNIAGSHDINLTTGEDLGENTPAQSFTAEALAALVVSNDGTKPTSVYLSLWEGEHALTAKLYLGTSIYTVPLDATVFTKGEVTSLEICLDDYEAVQDDSIQVTAIDSAEKLLNFLTDLKAGKEGEEMQQYRTIDGSYGLGADIDMSAIDMATWPQVTLTEDFNGCGFKIKGMVVRNPNIALFGNVAYGKTLSNIILDESCKLYVDSTVSASTIDNSWSLLVHGGFPTATASNHVCSGNLDNCVSYASVEVTRTGDCKDQIYIGSLIGMASGGDDDTQVPSQMSNCKNYGTIWIHDVNQGAGYGTTPYNYYCVIGGLIGEAGGYVVTNCENHGDVVIENCNMQTGTLYVGGLVGYNCNRVNSNISNLMGDVNNCKNYGNFLVGQDESKPVTLNVVGLAGICARFQWGGISYCENHGTMNIKATQADSFKSGGYSHSNYSTWSEYLASATNGLGFFSVGGISTFAQSNMDVGVDFLELNNYGNINVEVDTAFDFGEEGALYYADNTSVCVGGVMGLMGANAKNPRFSQCTNMGNVRLKSNKTSSEAFVGGVIGKAASNRNVKDGDFYSVRGCANTGKVEFVTDAPETTVAHVGGVVGGAIAGIFSTCLNAGDVSNASTHAQSNTAAIVGCFHNSNIGYKNVTANPQAEVTSASVGGSVNGVEMNEANFNNFVSGAVEYADLKFYTAKNVYFAYE